VQLAVLGVVVHVQDVLSIEREVDDGRVLMVKPDDRMSKRHVMNSLSNPEVRCVPPVKQGTKACAVSVGPKVTEKECVKALLRRAAR